VIEEKSIFVYNTRGQGRQGGRRFQNLGGEESPNSRGQGGC